MIDTTNAPNRGCLRILLGTLAFAILVSPGVARQAQADSVVQVVHLPDGALHPQTATDSHGRLHLIYFKGDPRHGGLFYARSDDGGQRFSAPLPVNSQPESVIVIGTIRAPQIAIGRNDRVHVAWMGSNTAEPKVNGVAVPMLYSRMNEAGDGFEPQRNIIRAHPGLDGGGSVAADSEGNVYVAWHAPDGGAREADRRVWIARSTDDGASFAPERATLSQKTGACGCCGMRIAAAAGGRVYVLFRSATEVVHRDMQLLESEDYGKTFKIVTTDPWEVAACVMSTAALVPTDTGVLAAWETHEQIHVLKIDRMATAFAAISVPGSSGNRKHPAIAINGRGEYIVAWTEGTGWNKGGLVAWQVYRADGSPLRDQSGRAYGLSAWNVPAVFTCAGDTFGIIF